MYLWTRPTKMPLSQSPSFTLRHSAHFNLRSNQPISQRFYVTAQYNKNTFKQLQRVQDLSLSFQSHNTLFMVENAFICQSTAVCLLIAGPWDTSNRNAQRNKRQEKIITKANVCFQRNSKSWYRVAKLGLMYSREQCSFFLLKATLVQGLISTHWLTCAFLI